MRTLEVIIERNKRKFSAALTDLELKLLTREKSHLNHKQQQRNLSSWEHERLLQLERELSTIVPRIQSGVSYRDRAHS